MPMPLSKEETWPPLRMDPPSRKKKTCPLSCHHHLLHVCVSEEAFPPPSFAESMSSSFSDFPDGRSDSLGWDPTSDDGVCPWRVQCRAMGTRGNAHASEALGGGPSHTWR